MDGSSATGLERRHSHADMSDLAGRLASRQAGRRLGRRLDCTSPGLLNGSRSSCQIRAPRWSQGDIMRPDDDMDFCKDERVTSAINRND